MADRPLTSSLIAVIKAIAGLAAPVANRILYFTSASAAAYAVITLFARTEVLSATSGSDLLAAIDPTLADLVSDGGYVRGTFVPAITFATPGDLAVVYSTQYGDYTRNGREITVNVNIVTSTFTFTTASGALRITGLPFTSANTTGLAPQAAVQIAGVTKAGYTSFVVSVAANSTNVTAAASGSGVGASAIVAADMPTAGTVVLRFTIKYHI